MRYGLIGKDISYSFSKKYFGEKFKVLNLSDHQYENFDLQSIDEFPEVIGAKIESIQGMNVTIPYKLEVFKYLDEIDDDARNIGAVNTIKILKDGRLKGFNTDVFGFEHSIKPLLQKHVKQALILGTGGASKAIAYVLDKLAIKYVFVSRNPQNENCIHYDQLTKDLMNSHHLMINCTPIGTFPEIESYPNIPYQFLTEKHFLFDLIYNPEETAFLKKGKEQGCIIKNGFQMLELQADKAWDIWCK